MKQLTVIGINADGTVIYDWVDDGFAPHKNRSTPKKPRRRMSTVLAPRLFKGHRP